MKYKFDAIKIEEKPLSQNSDEVSSTYVVKMDYKSLIDMCYIGKISINREVDNKRAKKMVNYIREKESFYPPIIVATVQKNLIKYDNINKCITIDSDNFDKEQDLLVIDGQHRYTSIKYLMNEDIRLVEGRYQTVFLIDNLDEFQQRKIFIDINDTTKKVTTGTKLRLAENIINYVSLNIVDNSELIQSMIIMDDNQTKNPNDIPYKFIIRGNERLLEKLDELYDKGTISIDDIDMSLESIYTVWNGIFNFISDQKVKVNQIITNEVFYIALCEVIKEDFEKYILTDKGKINDSINIEKLREYVEEIFKLLKEKINDINSKYFSEVPKTASEKIQKIQNQINSAIDISANEEELIHA